VNDQNPGAVAFYTALGFREIGHSPLDHAGKPYPLLHMARL
jgi:putative acetyltransferase